MTKDPVCGMEIDPNSAAAKFDVEGKTYYFCSMGCKKSFEVTLTLAERANAKVHCPSCGSGEVTARLSVFTAKTSRKS